MFSPGGNLIGCCRWDDAQQVAGADLAIESFCEGVFGFEAFQVQIGHTASAVG